MKAVHGCILFLLICFVSCEQDEVDISSAHENIDLKSFMVNNSLMLSRILTLSEREVLNFEKALEESNVNEVAKLLGFQTNLELQDFYKDQSIKIRSFLDKYPSLIEGDQLNQESFRFVIKRYFSSNGHSNFEFPNSSVGRIKGLSRKLLFTTIQFMLSRCRA